MDNKELHERDCLRTMFKSSRIRTMQISMADVGKIFVLNFCKTEARIMTREEFLALPIDQIGSWCEVDEFDVNT